MMTTSTQHFNTILTFLFLIKACHIPTPVLAYRVVGSENENKTFVPYEAGFVGHVSRVFIQFKRGYTCNHNHDKHKNTILIIEYAHVHILLICL